MTVIENLRGLAELSLNNKNEIENLRISVRVLNKEDIKNRSLPNQTTGLVVTKIENNSPLKNTTLVINDIIVEAQKKRLISIDDLKQITQEVLNSNQKTILFAIYNLSLIHI